MNTRTVFSSGDQKMRGKNADEVDNDVHHRIPQAVEDANNAFFTERKRVTTGHQNQQQQPVPAAVGPALCAVGIEWRSHRQYLGPDG